MLYKTKELLQKSPEEWAMLVHHELIKDTQIYRLFGASQYKSVSHVLSGF